MELKTFSDILEIRSGRNQKEVLNENGKYPILGSAGKIMGYADKFICEENTTIIGRKGTINNPIFITNKFWNVDTAFGLHALDELDKKYLFYFCQSFDFTKLDKGSGRPSLVKSDLLKISMYCPKLEIQKQIVKILDTAFEALEKAKTNLEKNLANTKELFDSKLNEIFSQKGEGWEEKTLGEVYDVRDGTHDSPRYCEIGYPLITSKNLKNGKIVYDKIKYITEHDYLNINKRSKVDVGDVLFAMIGTIGNPVVVIDEANYAIKNVALFKVDILNNSLFLKYYLDSSFVIEKMKKESKGTTQQFVGLGYLRNFPIRIPNIKKQELIVKELNTLESKTKQLEQKYQQKLDNLEELKKSLLQKAFSGELTK